MTGGKAIWAGFKGRMGESYVFFKVSYFSKKRFGIRS